MRTKHDRQNLFLSLCVTGAMLLLLSAASRGGSVVLVLSMMTFAFLGLTNYALIHEACHDNLNSNRRVNRGLGTLISWLFPVSLTFMKTAHQVHHLNNRTDGEMFDYYYPDDNMLIKRAQWYSILIGIYPPIIPLGSLVMAFLPGIFRLRSWQTAKSSAIIFDRGLFTRSVIGKIRVEVCLGIVFWVVVWQLLGLDPLAVAVLYGAFWINWSTRQYVTHAFSPRDVMNGAWNLKVSRLMGWIFLNGHWDLVHHKYPTVRWQLLPDLGLSSRPPISYWGQYFRLWGGPRPNTEPAPAALNEIP